MKNSIFTIGNRTRDLLACSAVPQPSAPPRAPCTQLYRGFILPVMCVEWNCHSWMNRSKRTNQRVAWCVAGLHTAKPLFTWNRTGFNLLSFNSYSLHQFPVNQYIPYLADTSLWSHSPPVVVLTVPFSSKEQYLLPLTQCYCADKAGPLCSLRTVVVTCQIQWHNAWDNMNSARIQSGH
jgi:hypothetical protein